MSALPELQTALAAQIRLGVAAPLGIDGPAALLATPQRLRIHQRHVRTSLTAALRARFPALARLVGDGFFAFLAAQFIAAMPPRDPRVALYGDDLPDFLQHFEPARQYPWLTDVARIECAVQAVAQAPLHTPLDAADLAGLPPDEAAGLRFRWNPAVHLVASDLPAAVLWRVAREGSLATRIDLDGAGPTRLLIRRRDEQVEARDLTPAAFRFCARLAAGAALGAAAGAAAQEDAAFDLAAAIAALFADGCVIGLLPNGAPQ